MYKIKRIGLLLLIVIIFSYISFLLFKGTSAVLEVPANPTFDDINFYKCVVKAYNSDNKTKLDYTVNLTDEQLSKVTRLYCNNSGVSDDKKIVSVKGLERLVNLESLHLNSNKIANLDVSKNIKLITLSVEYNQLTSLDVSRNGILTSLSLNYNQLTSLDVSKNIALTELYVARNQLTSLDVSKNTALTHLEVSGNQLKSLHVIGAISLTELYASENQLTILDVSNNTSLTELYANDNQLTILDVSNNTLLTYLDACSNQLISLNISGATALTDLEVDNNQLTNLDLSTNSNLIYLGLANNQLKALDVSQNVKLNILDIGFCRSYHPGGTRSCVIYQNNNSKLNYITSLDVSKNLKLNKLYVANNQLISLDVSKNTLLTELVVGNNQLISLDVSKNTLLNRLNVYNNQLSSLDMSQNLMLKDLRLGTNPLKEEIYVYKGEQFVIGENVKIHSEFNLGKLTWKSSDSSIVKINSDGLGEAVDLGSAVLNGKSEEYDNTSYVNVVVITSNKYLINEKNNYIYVGIDNDIDTIKSNISISNENIKIDINDNKLYVKYEDKILKEFDIISISSEKYDLNKEYIYLGSNDIDLSNIKVNNDNIKLDVNDNELYIKYNEEIIREYQLVKLSSEVYNLDNKYIYVANKELNLDNIINVGCSKMINNNKLYIKYEEEIIKVYDIIRFFYMDYDLSNDYIYLGDKELDITKINNINCSININDNNVLTIKYNNEIIKKYQFVQLSSEKYDLEKEYIYVGNGKLNLNYVNIIGGDKIIKDNKLVISYNNSVLKQYDVVSVLSNKYDLSKNNIYVGFNFKNDIVVENGNSVLSDNKLYVKYKDIVLDEYNLVGIKLNNYKIYGNSIVVLEEVSYNNFINNIEVDNGVTYKIYNDEDEVSSGNIVNDMVFKVYYDGNLMDEYLITDKDEYYEFDDSLILDEVNDIISNIDVGTSVDDIIKKINTNGIVSILDKDNNVKNSDGLKTGDKIRIELSSQTLIYKVSVNGDVNGDGNVNINDIINLSKYFINNNVIKDYVYIKAGDINNNGKIDINDIIKMGKVIVSGN